MKNPVDNNTSEWFKDWFNSPYYHVLYNNRDTNEADFFITNLINHLKLPQASRIWDLACGKGRHAIKFNQLGFQVIGTDLSLTSIQEASKSANNSLDFFVHDMRTPFRINYFNAVFNLFTSIGYFDNRNDSAKVFENVFNALISEGILVIDFLNAKKVKKNLVPFTEIEKENIKFTITKEVINERVIKRIDFNVNEKVYYFEEKVHLYTLNDFKDFAKNQNFKLQSVFGNYNLEAFDENNSDRLIMIFNK